MDKHSCLAWYTETDPMIIYRMVIVEGRCTKLQLLISYIYNHWLTQKYSEFWLVRYNAGYCCYFLLPSYIYDHCSDWRSRTNSVKSCSYFLSNSFQCSPVWGSDYDDSPPSQYRHVSYNAMVRLHSSTCEQQFYNPEEEPIFFLLFFCLQSKAD